MAKKAVALEDLSIVKDYIDNKASAALVTVDGKISTHNSDKTAHNDIRTAVSNAADNAISAQEQAAEAQQKATKAETDAANAQSTADAADGRAQAAQTAADNAAAAASDAQTTASEAKSIAEGRAKAVSFATKALMESTLYAEEDKTKYKVGDNIFIEELGVPDYWVKGINAAKVAPYGWYSLSELETQKVDLTNYARHQDVTDAINVHNTLGTSHNDIRTAVANKADKTVASTAANGLMSSIDKVKLEVSGKVQTRMSSRIGIRQTHLPTIISRISRISRRGLWLTARFPQRARTRYRTKLSRPN